MNALIALIIADIRHLCQLRECRMLSYGGVGQENPPRFLDSHFVRALPTNKPTI